jgi:hypothetical protein
MAKSAWFGALLLGAVCSLAAADVGYHPGIPAIATHALPAPPMQKAPWTPPEGGPGKQFASAVAALFDAGLPDPRGCEYREITVPVLWTRDQVQQVKTHGWLLPVTASAGFAICWDGLVYPVLYVGEKADPDADVASALAAEQQWRDELSRENPGRKPGRQWDASMTERAVRADTLTPLKACLLLRLGRAELAGKVWNAATEDFSLRGVHEGDPFMVFATDWLWAKYQRAITCQSRGLDVVALADLRGLDGLGPKLLDVAAERGYQREWTAQLIEFLDYVPSLLADEQRRSGVGELIDRLQEVHLDSHSVPPSLDYSDSEVMVQLVLTGEPAVGPLLDALEHESRLSRTVVYSRPWDRHWSLMPVRELEWRAATAILGGVPARNLDELRRWWTGNKDRPFVERLYATLADDGAGREMWLWAANRIVRPADEPIPPTELLSGWRRVWSIAAKPRWTGEALRDGRRPSVSDLMARRAAAIAETAEAGLTQFRPQDATHVGTDLARWDPKVAVEPLQKLTGVWENALSRKRIGSFDAREVGGALAGLTLARMHAGDPAALSDYAKWIEAGYTRDTRPMWLAPDDPAAREATEHLLEHVRKPEEADVFSRQLSPASPMLAVEPFRACVLQQLQNNQVLGPVRVTENGSLQPGFRGWTGPWPKRRPAPGTTADVRVCDSFAWNLSGLEGFPGFDPFAPQAERDKAIAECVRLLNSVGARFADAIDRDAYWAFWSRGNGGYERPFRENVFKPERVLP